MRERERVTDIDKRERRSTVSIERTSNTMQILGRTETWGQRHRKRQRQMTDEGESYRYRQERKTEKEEEPVLLGTVANEGAVNIM